ncbi:MAG: hypothetical protein HOE80_04715 [Candidatus Magasanikbacteria bacterium]|jgi:hypothetical protein|nr:hypothetical protein [Candidatus Magasanikbacteria bacterium]MBT4071992.1 hypothetical protein [Candidatus Magasanikbacteria bacterium]
MKKTILSLAIITIFLTGCGNEQTNIIGPELDLAPPEDQLSTDSLEDSELELADPGDENPGDSLTDPEIEVDLETPVDILPDTNLTDSELDLAPPGDENPGDSLTDPEIEVDLETPVDILPDTDLTNSELDLANPGDENPGNSLENIPTKPKETPHIGGSCNLIAKTSTCLEYVGQFWTEEQMGYNCYEGTLSFDPCEHGEIGGCDIGKNSMTEMVIWMYPYGASPISAKDAEAAKPTCDINPMGTWINAR